ncbi:FAM192A_Fyv6_N domain-containing protein [Trichoderma simmonsii]|uniref:FAM192A_Fyv6_N domain-containing protein n=1 Tax=Trichoderma simmonsii TaxID=1491479 RepID=A0A8G0PAR9_9HYPO|nr:FAM192A_Fyv6_N domain-containing protein [Trichoderma simmonsii]
MSSRFVSGGTISGEGSKDEAAVAATAREPLAKKSVEWETVQHELDEERKRREHARAELAEGGQQSLYDILQANKAAKQAAFEEQNKLKNQFRALDDDEIEFLDEVRAKEKAEEERARREVEEGLKAFRERQKSTGGSGGEASGTTVKEGGGGEEEEEWVVGGRKRKRHEREVLGVKKKAVAGDRGGGKDEVGGVDKSDGDDGKKKGESEGEKEKEKEKESEPPKEEKKASLGLVAYDSDSDDDE